MENITRELSENSKKMKKLIDRTEEKFKQLERDKSQAEMLAAVIVKRLCNIDNVDLSFENMSEAEFERIRIVPSEDDPSRVSITYLSED